MGYSYPLIHKYHFNISLSFAPFQNNFLKFSREHVSGSRNGGLAFGGRTLVTPAYRSFPAACVRPRQKVILLLMMLRQASVPEEEESVPAIDRKSAFRNINSATVYRTANTERTRIRSIVVSLYISYYLRHWRRNTILVGVCLSACVFACF